MRSDNHKRHQKTCGTGREHGGVRKKKENTNKQILEFEKSTYKIKKNKGSTITAATGSLRKKGTIIGVLNSFI